MPVNYRLIYTHSQTLNIYSNIFDKFATQMDEIGVNYMDEENFRDLVEDVDYGEAFILFCLRIGRPLYFLFQQADLNQSGKIYLEDFIFFLTHTIIYDNEQV